MIELREASFDALGRQSRLWIMVPALINRRTQQRQLLKHNTNNLTLHHDDQLDQSQYNQRNIAPPAF